MAIFLAVAQEDKVTILTKHSWLGTTLTVDARKDLEQTALGLRFQDAFYCCQKPENPLISCLIPAFLFSRAYLLAMLDCPVKMAYWSS